MGKVVFTFGPQEMGAAKEITATAMVIWLVPTLFLLEAPRNEENFRGMEKRALLLWL